MLGQSSPVPTEQPVLFLFGAGISPRLTLAIQENRRVWCVGGLYSPDDARMSIAGCSVRLEKTAMIVRVLAVSFWSLPPMPIPVRKSRRIAATPSMAEQRTRSRSDFLCCCNHDGLFADVHGLRHLFISSLERAGVTPKMAPTWPDTATSA